MEVDTRTAVGRRRDGPRRWALKKLDKDRLWAAVLVIIWPDNRQVARDVEEKAESMVNIVADACDACMPRSRLVKRRAAYWWTAEVAELRASAQGDDSCGPAAEEAPTWTPPWSSYSEPWAAPS
ncbi:hypothetical protein P5V15_002509 [Pogonomyrmex californicus]